MNDIENAVKAVLDKDGKHFEILVNLERALQLKNGENIDLNDVLVTDRVFKDLGSGDLSSKEDLLAVFNMKDELLISKEIVLNGEINLTTEYRKKLREQKMKQVIAEISKNAIDPRTNLPLPPNRVENALEQVTFKVSEFTSLKDLVKEAVEKISVLMPISFSEIIYQTSIPASYTGKILGILTRFGKVLEQNWQANGDLIIKIKVSPSKSNEFVDVMKKNTGGLADIKQVN